MTTATKIKLEDVHLAKGAHGSPEQGMCIT